MTPLKTAGSPLSSGWVLPVAPPYSLARTLSCGQVFRWRWSDDVATGVVAGRVIRIAQLNDGLHVDGPARADQLPLLRCYLGLDEPLAAIERHLTDDPVLRKTIAASSGIALMRQDPWECLVSFIISAFNNIPKIEQSLGRLATRLGDPVGETGRTFPSPERLAAASLPTLRRCLLGYRAPYVRAVARLVAGGKLDLTDLGRLPHDEARRALLALPGVGEKVADCVLLFAYGDGRAFPVDVWIQRVVEQRYFGGRPQTPKRLRAFAHARFGPLAGYAQQHLYFAGRMKRKQRVKLWDNLDASIPGGRDFPDLGDRIYSTLS